MLLLLFGLISLLNGCLVLGDLGLGEHITVIAKTVSLKEVCYNRQVPIVSVNEVKRMVMELDEDPTLCPENFKQSVYDLLPLFSLDKGERLCDEKKFEQIADYHFRYIYIPMEEAHLTKAPEKSFLRKVKLLRKSKTKKIDDHSLPIDYEVNIPISLKHFFQAWALQVSGLCRKSLLDNLREAIQDYMNEEDLELINQVVADPKDVKDPVTGQPISKLTLDNLIDLPQFDPETMYAYSSPELLDLTDDYEVDKFMHACLHRFKPIYSKLIIPLVRMARLGYDYLGSKVTSVNRELDKSNDFRRWLALTMICESQGEFVLAESKTNPIIMDDVHYTPMINYPFGDDLWIKGPESLAREFSIMNGRKSKGFKKITYKLGEAGRKASSLMDLHQFAWYRRNQHGLHSTYNSLSIGSNTISIALTMASLGRR